LHFFARLPLTPEVQRAYLAALGGELGNQEPKILVERLGRRGRRQVYELVVLRAADRLVLDGDITIVGEEQVEATTVRPSQFLRALGRAARQEPGISLVCQFLYSPGKHELLFPLPIPLPKERGFGFDEIRGARLVKRDGEGVEYQVIVDQPGGSDFSATVMVHVHTVVDATLPERLLGRRGR
jgi:hypothetical protein